MLKIRRVWRRTSSSQADPSPWRHCWTSWASCSNVSSASISHYGARRVYEPAPLSEARWQSISACQLWNVKCSQKVPLVCSPDSRPCCRHLTHHASLLQATCCCNRLPPRPRQPRAPSNSLNSLRITDTGDRLVQVVDSTTGTITRSYDPLDRLTSELTTKGRSAMVTTPRDGGRA